MRQHWHALIFSLLPGLVSSFIWVGDAAIRPHFTGECDLKLGCAGWIQVASAMGALSFLLSALGISAVAVWYRALLRQISLRWVLASALAVTTLLLFMLYTVGRWSVDSVASYFLLWAVIPFATSWVLLMLVRRLGPNNSFKPKPLRGSA